MDDRLDVANVVGSLAVCVDARRWSDLASLFALEVRVDYSSLFGGEPRVVTRDQLIDEWRRLLPGFTRTAHLIGTAVVTVEAVTAQAVAPVVAWHFLKEPELAGNDCWLVGGCYEMDFQRQDGDWQITALRLARAWAEGNLDLPKLAGARVAAERL